MTKPIKYFKWVVLIGLAIGSAKEIGWCTALLLLVLIVLKSIED
jgi:hypothetical protein